MNCFILLIKVNIVHLNKKEQKINIGRVLRIFFCQTIVLLAGVCYFVTIDSSQNNKQFHWGVYASACFSE